MTQLVHPVSELHSSLPSITKSKKRTITTIVKKLYTQFLVHPIQIWCSLWPLPTSPLPAWHVDIPGPASAAVRSWCCRSSRCCRPPPPTKSRAAWACRRSGAVLPASEKASRGGSVRIEETGLCRQGRWWDDDFMLSLNMHIPYRYINICIPGASTTHFF